MTLTSTLVHFQLCGMAAAAVTLLVLRLTAPRSVSADEVEKYRSQFVTGPPPRRAFNPPEPPSIACPKCGAAAGQWCSTFAPFAQYATCIERKSAPVSAPPGTVTEPLTVVRGAQSTL